MNTPNFTVIVPTMGDKDLLIPTLRRLALYAERSTVVVVVNPLDPEKAITTGEIKAILPDAVVRMFDKPVGFAVACNEGLAESIRHNFHTFDKNYLDLTVFLNDDVLVTEGWLDGMARSVKSEFVRFHFEIPDKNGNRPERLTSEWTGSDFEIGLVGPVSDNVAGNQSIQVPKQFRGNLDAFAAQVGIMNATQVYGVEFLSGFCLGITSWCLEGMVNHYGLELFDPSYGIGGYEDNDLCMKAQFMGYRAVIAANVFVHHKAHQSLDKHFPGQNRGMANRLVYYNNWIASAAQPIVAIYRMCITSMFDMIVFMQSIKRVGELVDGIAIVLTNNPLQMLQSQDMAFRPCPPIVQEFLKSISNKNKEEVALAFQVFVEGVSNVKTAVEVWYNGNERDERNRSIELAEKSFPDAKWLFSVDADEVPEVAWTKERMNQLTHHPDPMVQSWGFGWLNHWDSERLVRTDRPWADGGVYAQGMSGFRLWRIDRFNPRRILAGNEKGLHCGNLPPFAGESMRVSGLRFRHYGYMDVAKRYQKAAFYNQIDPNPDHNLTGGGYGHLTHEENMTMCPYVPHNQVGLNMMVHGGDSWMDVGRWMDQLHGLVAKMVIVWTDEKPASMEIRELCGIFNAKLVECPLNDNFANARNAGLSSLRAEGDIAWALMIDPDEMPEDTFAFCQSVRRMAESSDTLGWMFKFANLRPPETGEPPTYSESIRMIRLDPESRMWYSGRVHEGFDRAMREFMAHGIHPMLRYAPIQMINPGLALSDDQMEIKTRKYQRLLIKELEDNPANPGAWVALGVQLTNDGFYEKAEQCYKNAVMVAGDSYLPYREMMLHHLRQAGFYAEVCAGLVSQSHPYAPVLRGMLGWLQENAPQVAKVGLARRGIQDDAWDIELPYFPEMVREDEE